MSLAPAPRVLQPPCAVTPSCLRRRCVAAHASRPDPSSRLSAAEEEERRVEAMEASIRGKAPRRQIPIRGMEQKTEGMPSQYAEWKEGKLFPEGWESMDTGTKMTELYMGQRGFLFWTAKIAYGLAMGMLFAWVLFRFVGPNIGLYKLAGDLTPPPL
uniref:Uncharacterized protein n=1 Tax=Chlamydomonas euryale TaxID=1486919 RepID=A0A7R9VTP4_9CHLO